MMIEITSTPDMITYRGIQCRRWEGVTEGGNRLHVFVAGVAAHEGSAAHREIAAALSPCVPPEAQQVTELLRLAEQYPTPAPRADPVANG